MLISAQYLFTSRAHEITGRNWDIIKFEPFFNPYVTLHWLTACPIWSCRRVTKTNQFSLWYNAVLSHPSIARSSCWNHRRLGLRRTPLAQTAVVPPLSCRRRSIYKPVGSGIGFPSAPKLEAYGGVRSGILGGCQSMMTMWNSERNCVPVGSLLSGLLCSNSTHLGPPPFRMVTSAPSGNIRVAIHQLFMARWDVYPQFVTMCSFFFFYHRRFLRGPTSWEFQMCSFERGCHLGIRTSLKIPSLASSFGRSITACVDDEVGCSVSADEYALALRRQHGKTGEGLDTWVAEREQRVVGKCRQ